jgi:hypothetical protein
MIRLALLSPRVGAELALNECELPWLPLLIIPSYFIHSMWVAITAAFSLDASSNDGVQIQLSLRHSDAGSVASLFYFEHDLISGRQAARTLDGLRLRRGVPRDRELAGIHEAGMKDKHERNAPARQGKRHRDRRRGAAVETRRSSSASGASREV